MFFVASDHSTDMNPSYFVRAAKHCFSGNSLALLMRKVFDTVALALVPSWLCVTACIRPLSSTLVLPIPQAATMNCWGCFDSEGQSMKRSTSRLSFTNRGSKNSQSGHSNASRIQAWAVGTGVRVGMAVAVGSGIVGIGVKVGNAVVAVGANVAVGCVSVVGEGVSVGCGVAGTVAGTGVGADALPAQAIIPKTINAPIAMRQIIWNLPCR